jgi:hypothetical protein
MFSKKTLRQNILRSTALFVAFVFVFATASSSEARKRHRRHHRRAKKRAVINEPDLYQRIGGSKVVSELVDEWVKSAQGDGRLSGAFGGENPKPAALAKMRKDLVTEVCELSDGPCKMPDSKKLPETFALPTEKFVVFADYLVRSMDKLKIREREKNELLGRIGEVRVDGPADASDAEDDDSAAD